MSRGRDAVVWAFGFVAGIAAGVGVAAHAGEGDAGYRALAVFARAFQHIESAWVGDVTPEALSRGAIGGKVATLDAQSRYYDPDEAKAALGEQSAPRPMVTTVRHARLEGAAYVAIDAFRDTTAVELERALRELRPISGLVLDLRDDTGGLLQSAVRIADAWLAEGVIVSTRGKGKEPEVQRAHPKGTEPDYPLVVLVNERTASAAEVLAAALVEHGRAALVGRPTYGKGSVQTVIDLEDGSALKLTVARYYTPSGRSLEGSGLVPATLVDPAPTPPSELAADPQVRAALAALQDAPRRSFTGPKARAISKP